MGCFYNYCNNNDSGDDDNNNDNNNNITSKRDQDLVLWVWLKVM